MTRICGSIANRERSAGGRDAGVEVVSNDDFRFRFRFRSRDG